MSGIGGGAVSTFINPFAPTQTTTQNVFPIPPQTSTFVSLSFLNPATTTTPTPTPSTISKIVTETLPSRTSLVKLTPTFIRDRDNNNNNNNNTISTAAIIFSIMIGFIIVGGCIALILARAGSKKKNTNIEQRNLYGDEMDETDKRVNVYNQINNISPPLNLPPPPPRHSPPSSPQRSPLLSPPSSPRRSLPSTPRDSQGSPALSPRRSPSLPLPPPPIPQHLPIVLYRNPSLTRHGSSKRTYDPVRLDPNHPYQKYSQLSSQSAHNAEKQTNIDEPP